MIVIKGKKDCCGCGACVQRCPKHCISLIEDEEGFLYPQVDKHACIDCTLCESVCPLLNRNQSLQPLSVLAVKNRNEEERMNSSSGGVFVALARNVLAKGGVVFGAVFDERWEVKHTWIDTVSGLVPMMGSKYLQSRTENTYYEAEQFLKQGREVLYVGSPCQIAGLKKFLHKEYTNLLTVDFLCHGVPSPSVWRKYLNEIKTKSVIGKRKYVFFSSAKLLPVISGISFRDKTLRGWKKFSFVVWKNFADKRDNETVILSEKHHNNLYMKGFLSNLYLRPSCYSCPEKNLSSGSDITIADFWNVEKLFPDWNDDKGVSLVLINTNKGAKVLNCLDLLKKKSSFKIACDFNSAIVYSANMHPHRKMFFEDFKRNGDNVQKLILKYCYSPEQRLKRIIRIMLIKIKLYRE